jgi:Cu2+-containing amine oxidase
MDPLLPEEILEASAVVQVLLGLTPENVVKQLRFVAVTLLEPAKLEYISRTNVSRKAEIIALNAMTGIASEYHVALDSS